LVPGSSVNLERPLKTDERLGGHFVLGHVDTTGVVSSVEELTNSHFVKISYPKNLINILFMLVQLLLMGLV
jgi:riboflavin synthase